MVKALLSALAGVIIGMIAGCLPTDPASVPDSIESIRLSMSDEAFSDLGKSVYLNRWVWTVINSPSGPVKAQIRVHGGISRDFPKKSYQLIPFSSAVPDKREGGIILSAQYTDITFARYRLADHLFRRAGLFCSDITPVALYINGVYQGLYLQIEKIDEAFLRRRGLPLSSVYKLRTHGRFTHAGGILASYCFDKIVPEDDQSYADIDRLIALADRGITEENSGDLEQVLDIHSALDYYAACRLTYNWDGTNNNAHLYFDPAGKRFLFMPWDLDHTFEQIVPIADFERQFLLPDNLFEQLIAIPKYRDYVIRRMAEIFDYSAEKVLLDSIIAETAPLVPFEQAYTGEDDYRAKVEQISTCLESVREQLSQP
jgi:spore coat protein CotH